MAGIVLRLGINPADAAAAKRALVEVRDTGTGAFSDIAKASETASARQIQNYERNKRAVSELQAAQSALARQINASTGVSVGGGNSARESAMAIEAAFKAQENGAARVRAMLKAAAIEANPLAAAQDHLNKELAEFNALASTGAIKGHELAAAEALLRRRFDETSAAIQKQGGLTRNQIASRANVGRQFADIFTTGLSGMPAHMIIIQQAPQLLDAWSTAGIKVSRSMLLAGGSLGALAVGLGIATKSGFDFVDAQNKAELALMGVGRASGLSASQLEGMAFAASSAADITVGAARDIQNAYLQAGIRSGEVIAELTGLTKDYSLVAGKDMKESGDALAKAFADPARAGVALLASLGALDYATKQNIITLTQQGDKAAAQAVIMDRLSEAVAGATDKTFGLSRMWDAVAGAASRAYAEMGKAVSLPFRNDPDAIIERFENNGMRSRLFGRDEYEQALKAREEQSKADATKADKARRDAEALAINEKADGYLPKEAQKRTLAADRADIEKKLTAGLIEKGKAERALAEIRKKEVELDKPAGGTARLERLGREAAAARVNTEWGWRLIDAQSAGSAAMKEAELRREAYTEATRKGIGAEAEYQRHLQRFIADTAVAGAKEVAATNARIAAAEAANAAVSAGLMTREQANAQSALDIELQDLIIARDKATGKEKEKLTAEIEALTEARKKSNDIASAGAVIDATDANKRQIEDMKLQLQLLHLTNDQRAVALARERAIRELERRDTPQSLEEKQAYIDSEVGKATADNDLRRGQYVKGLMESFTLDRAQAQLAYDLAFATDQVRGHELEKLRLKQDMERNGLTMADAAYQSALRELEVVQQLTDAEEKRRAYYDEIVSMKEGTIDRAGALLQKGNLNLKDWRDEALLAIKDITVELIKMSLINPWKNWALGGNLPTVSSGGGAGGIFNILGSLFGGGGGGGSYAPLEASMAQLGGIRLPSFDGGGWTGSGPRTGGLDGKGGFLGLIHPQETVVDHTRDMLRRQSATGGTTIVQNISHHHHLEGAVIKDDLIKQVDDKIATGNREAVRIATGAAVDVTSQNAQAMANQNYMDRG